MTETATLAERLGYAASDRLLIVNCDDLGSSHAANVATLRAMDEGVATSATLMVPCPWAREAARMFQGRDIGVHLTITAEYPGYRWRSLTGAASLHDDDGFLPSRVPAAIAKADPADVRAEYRAQIDQALAWGVDVTHLDNHMGAAHVHPPFVEIYLDLAAEYRLPVRIIRPRDLNFPDFEPTSEARRRGVLFNEHVVVPWPRVTREVFFKYLPNLPAGVSEIFAHPVDDGDELRGYDPDNPEIRAADAICLIDPEVRRLVADCALKPISYRPLRDLQRAS
jgi:chitin disaccharide deacetylase